MASTDAARCIEIIRRRTPLTYEEMTLMEKIINDIRFEFELPGAVHPSKLEDDAGRPPKEWIW